MADIQLATDLPKSSPVGIHAHSSHADLFAVARLFGFRCVTGTTDLTAITLAALGGKTIFVLFPFGMAFWTLNALFLTFWFTTPQEVAFCAAD